MGEVPWNGGRIGCEKLGISVSSAYPARKDQDERNEVLFDDGLTDRLVFHRDM